MGPALAIERRPSNGRLAGLRWVGVRSHNRGMNGGVSGLDFWAQHGFNNSWRLTGGVKGAVSGEGQKEDEKLVES